MMTHQDRLRQRCRFCGSDINTNATLYRKEQFKHCIKAFQIDISHDVDSVHPPYVCNSCRGKLDRWKKKKQRHKKEDPVPFDPYQWEPHSDTCSICPSRSSNSAETVHELASAEAEKYGMTTWSDDGCVIITKFGRGGTSIERHLIIHPDHTWTAAIIGQNGKNIAPLNTFPSSVTCDNVKELICMLGQPRICEGNVGYDDLGEEGDKFLGQLGQTVATICKIPDPNGTSPTNTCKTVRHVNCSILTDSNRCGTCTIYRSALWVIQQRKNSKNQSDRKSGSDMVSSRTRNDYLSESEKADKLAQLQAERLKLKAQNNHLRAKIAELITTEGVVLDKEEEQVMEDILTNCPEIEETLGKEESPHRLLWEEQKKVFSLKDSRQMRWHPAIIRWCIAIFSKSSSAYNTLRKSPFVKLPHEATLRKYMQFTTPKTGVNPEVLNFIYNDWKLHDLPPHQKNITLVFDEMQIKSGLVYSKSSGKLVGFTDHGSISNELENFDLRCKESMHKGDSELDADKAKPQLASQVLVLMARGICSSMRVPVAYFPTRSANSHQLYHCLWPAVKYLSSMGLTVRAFVCDGASWNRKFFNHHTLASEPGRVTYYSKHPFLYGQRLYFICDVPHLIKTTRNTWENSGANQKSRHLHVSKLVNS